MTLHATTLRYLIKVAEHGSIRKAADELNVASSAVNRQIINIERSLNTKLFDRTPRGVRLTQAGELLVSHARQTLEEYRRIVSEISSQSGAIHGHVRIVGIASLIECVMPSLLADMTRQFPEIDLTIVNSEPGRAAQDLRSENFDIGLLFLDRHYSQFELRAEISATIGAIMRFDHPLAGQKQVTLSDCVSHSLALFSDNLIIKSFLEAECRQTGADLSPRILTNSMGVIRQSVGEGIAIGFFTKLAFLEDIADGHVLFRPITGLSSETGGIGMFVKKSKDIAPAVEAVSNYLQAAFATLDQKLASLP